jgi:hypothetical protein
MIIAPLENQKKTFQTIFIRGRICNLHCGNPRLATHLKLQLAKGSMDLTAIRDIFRPSVWRFTARLSKA